VKVNILEKSDGYGPWANKAIEDLPRGSIPYVPSWRLAPRPPPHRSQPQAFPRRGCRCWWLLPASQDDLRHLVDGHGTYHVNGCLGVLCAKFLNSVGGVAILVDGAARARFS
jgi:hypothetical protein